jgi:hypothetical protein
MWCKSAFTTIVSINEVFVIAKLFFLLVSHSAEFVYPLCAFFDCVGAFKSCSYRLQDAIQLVLRIGTASWARRPR